MSLSNYGEGAILDHLFGIATLTSPTLYLAVSTADPGEDGSGAAEPVGNGYARVVTADTDWQRTANVVDNVNQLSFPEATGAWGTLTHAALYDAATGGNLIASAALTASRAPVANDTLRFPVGNITFTLD